MLGGRSSPAANSPGAVIAASDAARASACDGLAPQQGDGEHPPRAATAVATHIALLEGIHERHRITDAGGRDAREHRADHPRSPRVPPIMRFIDRIPEATPALATGTAFIAAVDIGDITSAMPMPPPMRFFFFFQHSYCWVGLALLPPSAPPASRIEPVRIFGDALGILS